MTSTHSARTIYPTALAPSLRGVDFPAERVELIADNGAIKDFEEEYVLVRYADGTERWMLAERVITVTK